MDGSNNREAVGLDFVIAGGVCFLIENNRNGLFCSNVLDHLTYCPCKTFNIVLNDRRANRFFYWWHRTKILSFNKFT